VIIGTRLVRAVADSADGDAAVSAVTAFLRETRSALSG
jgi:tryptophan synthase alpha subunit